MTPQQDNSAGGRHEGKPSWNTKIANPMKAKPVLNG
jgi:hypothetical protein